MLFTGTQVMLMRSVLFRDAQAAALQQQPPATAAELVALQKAHKEQSAALQAATQQLSAAQEHNGSLQEEVDRLSSAARESSQASDLQRQFREVTGCPMQEFCRRCSQGCCISLDVLTVV